MKEKLYNDLGLDNGEDILKKFNISELIEVDEKTSIESKKMDECKKIKEIKDNI